eukprot:GHVO01037977.1.p1 GENE.GHVO01037977.1~~GHVO01037977.1.p1  ORF type:complete len:266 (+),score=33.84 GHVO01037977.1:69-866(+)
MGSNVIGLVALILPLGIAGILYGILGLLYLRLWLIHKRGQAAHELAKRRVVAAFFDKPPRDISEWTTETIHQWDEENKVWVDVETGLQFFVHEAKLSGPQQPYDEEFSFIESAPEKKKSRKISLKYPSFQGAKVQRNRQSFLNFVVGNPETYVEAESSPHRKQTCSAIIAEQLGEDARKVLRKQIPELQKGGVGGPKALPDNPEQHGAADTKRLTEERPSVLFKKLESKVAAADSNVEAAIEEYQKTKTKTRTKSNKGKVKLPAK